MCLYIKNMTVLIAFYSDMFMSEVATRRPPPPPPPPPPRLPGIILKSLRHSSDVSSETQN